MPMPIRDLAPALLAALTLTLGCDRCAEPKAPRAETATLTPATPAAVTAAPTQTPAASAAPALTANQTPAATGTPALVPAPTEAQAPTATQAPAPTVPPTPPPAVPVSAILREAVSLEPGVPPVPLHADTRTTVDPAATFRVELSAAVPDARLLLLDASDALVAAEGTHEVGASTKLTLSPTSPLVPGSRYTLRLDGAVTRDLHASDGRVFAPLAHPLLSAGTAPAKEPKPAAKKKARRR